MDTTRIDIYNSCKKKKKKRHQLSSVGNHTVTNSHDIRSTEDLCLRDISTTKKLILGSPSALTLSSSSVNHLRILKWSTHSTAQHTRVCEDDDSEVKLCIDAITHGWMDVSLPLSDIVGVGEVNGRIHPDYDHPRNMPRMRILLRVPVDRGAWKVSQQHSPGSCYLDKYFGKRD